MTPNTRSLAKHGFRIHNQEEKSNLNPPEIDLELFPSFSSEHRSKRLVNRTPDEKVMVKNVFYRVFPRTLHVFVLFCCGRDPVRSRTLQKRAPRQTGRRLPPSDTWRDQSVSMHGKYMRMCAYDSSLQNSFLIPFFPLFFLHIFS